MEKYYSYVFLILAIAIGFHNTSQVKLNLVKDEIMDKPFMISKYGFAFLFFCLLSNFTSAGGGGGGPSHVYDLQRCFSSGAWWNDNKKTCEGRVSNNSGDPKNCGRIRFTPEFRYSLGGLPPGVASLKRIDLGRGESVDLESEKLSLSGDGIQCHIYIRHPEAID